MKKIVVLTGAGISAESGLRTFRDSDGLWEGYDVTQVASPQGWAQNRELVLNFYNERRRQAEDAQPNLGHQALADLQKQFDVQIITQNIDDLHERAGSKKVLHLHGEIFKARSTVDEQLIYPWKRDISLGDKCEKGSQLRPHIVWFGEMVPLLEPAIELTLRAEIFMVVGTSLVVYPAASLVSYVPRHTPIYVIDPHMPEISPRPQLHLIPKKAGEGLPKLVAELLNTEKSEKP